MVMKLEFLELKNNNIFQLEFADLADSPNRFIDFKQIPQSSGGIAVMQHSQVCGHNFTT